MRKLKYVYQAPPKKKKERNTLQHGKGFERFLFTSWQVHENSLGCFQILEFAIREEKPYLYSYFSRWNTFCCLQMQRKETNQLHSWALAYKIAELASYWNQFDYCARKLYIKHWGDRITFITKITLNSVSFLELFRLWE